MPMTLSTKKVMTNAVGSTAGFCEARVERGEHHDFEAERDQPSDGAPDPQQGERHQRGEDRPQDHSA